MLLGKMLHRSWQTLNYAKQIHQQQRELSDHQQHVVHLKIVYSMDWINRSNLHIGRNLNRAEMSE